MFQFSLLHNFDLHTCLCNWRLVYSSDPIRRLNSLTLDKEKHCFQKEYYEEIFFKKTNWIYISNSCHVKNNHTCNSSVSIFSLKFIVDLPHFLKIPNCHCIIRNFLWAIFLNEINHCYFKFTEEHSDEYFWKLKIIDKVFENFEYQY